MSESQQDISKFDYNNIDTTNIDNFLLSKRSISELSAHFAALLTSPEKMYLYSKVSTLYPAIEVIQFVERHSKEVLDIVEIKNPTNGWHQNLAGTIWEHYMNGELHSIDDQPAMITFDGLESWFLNGRRHRTVGPASKFNGETQDRWFYNGQQIYILKDVPKDFRKGISPEIIMGTCYLERSEVKCDVISFREETVYIGEIEKGRIYNATTFSDNEKIFCGNPFE